MFTSFGLKTVKVKLSKIVIIKKRRLRSRRRKLLAVIILVISVSIRYKSNVDNTSKPTEDSQLNFQSDSVNY